MPAGVVLTWGLCLGGCDDDGVRAYRVPKEAAPASSAPRESAEVAWSVPSGWVASANNPPPRVATFQVGPAGSVEVSVTKFPGEAGGLAANINRWRGQLGLEAVADAQAEEAAARMTVGGVEIAVVRLAGGKGMDMVGAVIRPGDGQTWFVKAVGAPGEMDAVRTQVEEFARSFRLVARATAASPAAAGVLDRLSKWTPPSNWKAEEDTTGMAAAVFSAEGAAGKVRVTLTVLEGEGGGALMNINRWRGQMGLPPIASVEDPSVERTAEGALMVRLTDAGGEKGMAGAILPEDGRTWYFKMTGPAGAVGAERASFDAFVRAGAR